jgi:hypothetical protein
MEREIEQLIRDKARILAQHFPTTANYESRCSLWKCGLQKGLVSEELYSMAEKYYGSLWTYVGD